MPMLAKFYGSIGPMLVHSEDALMVYITAIHSHTTKYYLKFLQEMVPYQTIPDSFSLSK
jgi:hypothetical protein